MVGVHTNVILQLAESDQDNQIVLRSRSKELRNYFLHQYNMVLLELKYNAMCCILFEIHINFGIVYFQNSDKVESNLVFHTL